MKEAAYALLWRGARLTLRLLHHLGVANLRLGRRTVAERLWGAGAWLVPPPSTEVEVTLPWGHRIAVPPGHLVARSLMAGRYEEDTTALVQRLVQEGMTVADVGAHIGYYALLASHLVGPRGRVYAFEPDPETYRYLVRNVQQNGCRNVTTVPKAAYRESATLAFAFTPGGIESHLGADGPQGLVQVEAVRLDEFFAQEGWPPLDLLVMDIEGAEAAALEGLHETAARSPALRCIIEFAPDKMAAQGATPQGLAAALLALGFQHGYVIGTRLRPFSLAAGLPPWAAGANILCTREPVDWLQ